jgi:uncharacterized protein
MIEIDKLEGFAWDKGNSEKNLIKHNVTDSEAEQVFFNNPLIISEDETHSTELEIRFAALGKTDNEKTLTIIFTIRNNLIRIISAREMSKKERKIYNEKAEENT